LIIIIALVWPGYCWDW